MELIYAPWKVHVYIERFLFLFLNGQFVEQLQPELRSPTMGNFGANFAVLI